MGNKLEEVTVDNATDVLCWLPDFGIVVCKAHGFAVHNVSDHLRHLHRGTAQQRREVAALFAEHRIREPQDVQLPEPLGSPFECLGEPIRAFICEEPECGKISRSRDAIRIHCNREHDWRSTREHREHWHQVWAQTFFNSAGLQRYFTVDYDEEATDETSEAELALLLATSNSDSASLRRVEADENDLAAVLSDWDVQLAKREKELEIADEAVAKTDHTLWFKRNQWPEHFKGCNLRHLSRATRLPDRDEELLLQAVGVNTALIERCVKGLRTLDLETRRWLRSAKQTEPDVRPFARLQNEDSQLRYANYFARLICYALRVLASEEVVNRAPAEDEEASLSGDEDEEDSNSDSEQDDSITNESEFGDLTPASTNVMKDARILFPWQGRQKELLQAFRHTLQSGVGEELEQDALLEFYRSIIFQRVRGNVFVSALLHYLAVLGIDEEVNRLRTANDFSYMLAGVVYCTRALAIEVLLPSADRDDQGERDDREFIKLRGEYLADGSFSVMSKMLSLLAYSKSLAFNHSNAGAVFWSDDRLTMTYKGDPIELAAFRRFVHSVIKEAEVLLWAKLLLCREDERFELPLNDFRDDVTFTKRGWSFILNKHNGLDGKREWLLRRLLSKRSRMRKDGTWSKGLVKSYLREVDRFRELLLLCVHVCGGQPARGTEITSIRFRNGFMQDRNIFMIHGQVVVVTRYHKSQSQLDKPKVIPRFLPWRVGQMMVIYLAYIQPLQDYLMDQVKGSGWTDYVWANEHGAWETDRLTRIMKRESQKSLGLQLTTHDYRHVAISMGREVVGAGFAKGYQEGIDENAEEEEEVDEDGDTLEVSAGRGGEVGANRYGVPLDVIKHLSNKTIDTFRPLSTKWHDFLGLESRRGAGSGKRALHMRGASVEVESDTQHSERRAMISVQNNNLGRLRLPVQHRDELDSRWYFGADSSPSSAPPPARSSPLATRSSPPSVPLQQHSPPAGGTGSGVTFGERSGEAKEHRYVGEEELQQAMQKALQMDEVSFRSQEQQEALETIVNSGRLTPLVVILPTGGGKSLLFMAPACLEDAGVTIVVVPYRALINNLVATARRVGIDSVEWRPGEQNPVALTFVSADLVSSGAFMGYAQLLSIKGLLRRVFVDECHLTFTASDWRPKLADVRQVRQLKCPTIMLTATLPVLLEAELEESMAARTAQYIRAATTRVRTRYIVHEVKGGTLEQEVIEFCRRMKKHLRLHKGVIYSRSREQCERLAQELKCAYYHAGSVDNVEQLERWVLYGGLIVATSALGTGVDFPGIVFILHVDLPYGMIDFAQESGRGGRAGEDVDSVVLVEQGKVDRASKESRGVDDVVIGEFVRTRQCRRTVMSAYLDGTAVECGGELARCDNCGEGLTSIQRCYARDAVEQERFEKQMDRLVDEQGCMGCFVAGAEDVSRPWDHRSEECLLEGRFGCLRVEEAEVERFRSMIRFEKKTHSCFKCGISQRLCRTGVDGKNECQWPAVACQMLRRIGELEGGLEVLRIVGYEGEWGEWEAYTQWLSQAYGGRVWREVMSNAMVSLIRFLDWRHRQVENSKQAGGGGQSLGLEGCLTTARVIVSRRSEGLEGEGLPVRTGVRSGEFVRRLRQWQGICLICRARYGVFVRTHETWKCKRDEFLTSMMKAGLTQLECMEPSRVAGGWCWAPGVRCVWVERDECEIGELAGKVAMALLYVGRERERAQEWVAQDEKFVRQSAEDNIEALGEFFRGPVEWEGGVESNRLCELIWRFGGGE